MSKGGFGTTLALAVVVVVLAMALGVGLGRFGGRMPLVGSLFEEQPAKTRTSGVVVEGVRDLDRLATVRWTESVVVTKESGGNGIERLLTGEKLLLVATGEVEAGVDLSRIGPDDVQVNGESVRIRLPEPQILSTALDEDKTRVYDRDYDLLNLHPDDDLVEAARADAEREVLSAAKKNGILDQAGNNAEESIRAFVLSLGFKKVRFVE